MKTYPLLKYYVTPRRRIHEHDEDYAAATRDATFSEEFAAVGGKLLSEGNKDWVEVSVVIKLVLRFEFDLEIYNLKQLVFNTLINCVSMNSAESETCNSGENERETELSANREC